MINHIYPFNARRAKTRGFTIVELLIVIVVIAIIATITIVSYTGIQDRANRVATTQALAQYVKALTLYRTTNPSYPTGDTNLTGFRCIPDSDNNSDCGYLGSGAPTCPDLGGYKGVSDPVLESQLKTVVSPLPKVSSQAAMCGGQAYRGSFYAQFFGGDNATVIGAYLKGKVECPSVASLDDAGLNGSVQEEDVTLCFWVLQANN